MTDYSRATESAEKRVSESRKRQLRRLALLKEHKSKSTTRNRRKEIINELKAI